MTIASNLNEKGSAAVPLVYIGLGLAGSPSTGEWYRGHVKMDTLTLFGTNADAIKVVGTGFLDIRNLHAGGTGDQAFYGGPATITERCVNAAGPDTDVTVSGGFCHSHLTDIPGASREAAMYNVSKVSDVRNVSPVGLLSAPFSESQTLGVPATIGLGGSTAVPTVGICYVVRGVDILLGVSGGTAVVVELRDGDDQLVFGGLSNLAPTAIPVGWKVCFPTFETPPTVRVGGS